MNKRLLAATLLLVPGLAFADDTPVRPTPVSPVAQLVQDIGIAHHYYCTVFLVTPIFFVAAGHCVDPTKPLNLQVLPDLNGDAHGEPISVKLAAWSNVDLGLDDWSIFTYADMADVIEDWKPVTLDCADAPKVGDNITYQGYPHAQSDYLTTERGYIDTTPQAPDGGPPLYSAAIPVSGGASGAPVFNSDGKVIGILAAENSIQPAWAYIQPITPICNELKAYLPSP